MDDVRGLFLGMPHGTTPAAVTTNKNIIMSSFKSSGNIQKKESGPYRGLQLINAFYYHPIFSIVLKGPQRLGARG